MTKTTVCASLLFFSPTLLACTQLPAATAFIVINDKDGDRTLNFDEWITAHSDENFEIDFFLNNKEEFVLFDRNLNGKIEPREIGFDKVRYLQNPCDKYQMRVRARMNQGHAMGFIR
ncbi:hypothetical protein ACKLNO_05700 [Neisseriaceae bacterium B1]